MNKELAEAVVNYAKEYNDFRKPLLAKEKQNAQLNELFALKHSVSLLKKEKGPALLVGAGPSIKNIQETDATIFCASRSYPILLEKGIIPDYIVHLDMHNKDYGKRLSRKERSILIVPLHSDPDIRDIWPNIYYFRDYEVYRKHKKIIGQRLPKLNTMSSVGGALLSIADYLHYDPICFIGYDFATDAEGKFYTNQNNPEDEYREFTNYYGKIVKTTRKYYLHMMGVLALMQKLKHTYYSASEGILGNTDDRGYINSLRHISIGEWNDICQATKANIQNAQGSFRIFG